MSEPGVRVVVGPGQAGERVDVALPALLPLSRRRARALLAAGAVERNGEPLRVQGRILALGDVLAVCGVDGAERAALAAAAVTRTPAPVRVLLDDGWLLAADKAANVLSQPAEERAPGELAMDELLALRRAWESGRRPFLRLVHRLDRVTSGVLLFAAREAALLPLQRAWNGGHVARRYLALVEGEPGFASEELRAPIGRDPEAAWRFRVHPSGDAAATQVRVLARGGGAALVECALVTGRTHQVRVHLAHRGHPVLGDRLYGATRDAPRALLHAASLRLPHPRDGATVEIVAPVPDDLRAAAQALGLAGALPD